MRYIIFDTAAPEMYSVIDSDAEKSAIKHFLKLHDYTYCYQHPIVVMVADYDQYPKLYKKYYVNITVTAVQYCIQDEGKILV